MCESWKLGFSQDYCQNIDGKWYRLYNLDIFVNVVEYPSVKVGEANIRISLTPEHTQQQINQFVDCFQWSCKVGREVYQRELEQAKKTVPTAKL